MRRWLVIIARDQPKLWVTWASFYGGAETVEVLFDRREGRPWAGVGDRPERRTHPSRDADLPEHGFLVIPNPN